MKRRFLLCTAAPLALWSGSAIFSHGAAAQVTIPLPSAPGSVPQTGTPATIPLPQPDTGPDTQSDSGPETGPEPTPAPPAQEPIAPQYPIGPHGRPDINPYDRDIDMTVPLTFQSSSLGEVPLRL